MHRGPVDPRGIVVELVPVAEFPSHAGTLLGREAVEADTHGLHRFVPRMS